MSKGLNLSDYPRLHQEALSLVEDVYRINWATTFGSDDGSCIPIAVFSAAYLVKAGFPARVTEAAVMIRDPLLRRTADTGNFEVEDKPGERFSGHCVVYVPNCRMVLDLSLPTQKSLTMKDLGVPHLLAGGVDHTIGEVGFRSPLGRGEAIYRIFPKRDGWKTRNWPYRELREVAREMRGMKRERTA